jgi:hypothetical protein
MFRMRVRMAVGRLLNDDQISDALRSGGDQMQTGIMTRCVDYDRDFKLRRLGLSADQRAVSALYIFSKEVKSKEYITLEEAIRNYVKRMNIHPPFANVDKHITWVKGEMTWTH